MRAGGRGWGGGGGGGAGGEGGGRGGGGGGGGGGAKASQRVTGGGEESEMGKNRVMRYLNSPFFFGLKNIYCNLPKYKDYLKVFHNSMILEGEGGGLPSGARRA